MSHVSKIELDIKDLQALETACCALGLEFRLNQSSYYWYGTDKPGSRYATEERGHGLPEGFTLADLGKCDHAIRCDGDKYEIGIAHRRDGRPGHVLLMDNLMGGRINQLIGPNAANLKREYAAAVATKHYARKGYRVVREQGQNGEIILRARR